MKKALISLTAAAAIAAGAVMVPDTADASSRGRRNTAIVAGVIGAILLGTIVANQYRYERGYVRYRSYRHRHPVACRGGYWARKPVYRHGRIVGWSEPRFFCP